ncbi:hypothetical protein LDO48_01485 [Pantoea agglomerans]|nr:hypothetical protein [Pantoea agglomerans]
MNKIKAMPDLLALNENHRWKKCKDFSYTEKRRSDSQPLRGVEKLSQSGDSVAGYFCRWTQCLTLGLLLRFQPGGGEYDQHYCAFLGALRGVHREYGALFFISARSAGGLTRL